MNIATLSINILDPKIKQIMDLASQANIDWCMSGKKLVMKIKPSQNDTAAKIMEMSQDYTLS